MLVLPVWAAYDPTDPLVLEAQLGVRHDDNLFRLSDGVDPVGRLGDDQRSDTVIEPRMSLHGRLPVSRQTLYVDAEVWAPMYLHYDDLNYTGWSGEAGWNWQLGNDWSGMLRYSDLETLSSFEDVARGVVDMYRNRTGEARADWRLVSNWVVSGGVTVTGERHDLRTDLDYDETRWTLGTTVRTGKGSEFGVQANYAELEYRRGLLGQMATRRGYRQHGADLIWRWPVTGLTELGGSFGWVNWQRFEGGNASNNFVGAVNASWQLSERLDFDLALSRSFDDPGQNLVRRVIDRYQLNATFDATSKVTVLLAGRYDKRSAARSGLGGFDDETLFFRSVVDYQFHRAVTARAYVQWQSREAELSTQDYDSTMYGASLIGRF
ncbi:hypothetical protein [Chitinolyticbacter albus]|uniref:hypothetical protein n=1 Tax=Chitinolyticbacter albus TaxID=2961951 RepID=UPI00210DD40C|nr:hypothetical protein [Chitinolyticbacter albus]